MELANDPNGMQAHLRSSSMGSSCSQIELRRASLGHFQPEASPSPGYRPGQTEGAASKFAVFGNGSIHPLDHPNPE